MPAIFDAVVVGSGFGGAVSAYRLSAAGRSVCVLERGKTYKPGSFARTPDELKNAFWDPSNGQFGLFNVWSFKNTDVIVSSGLGGGSLIYANVLVEKPAEWFDGWPINYAQLKTHYQNVKNVLKPVKYPSTKAPYDEAVKASVLKQFAQKNAADFDYLPLDLAVSFGKDNTNPIFGEQLDDDHNMHGSLRFGCRLCGECYLGCNYGSKNTVDLNYLSMAKSHGADIRSLCEVKEIKQREGGYTVKYVVRNPEDPEADEVEESIDCKKLVLAAGSLGTTYLLLKNHSNLPNLSKKLGHQFSGNGDVKTIAMNCKTREEKKTAPLNLKPYLGPVITGALKRNGGDNDKFLIEDWSYPSSLLWLLEAIYLPTLPVKIGTFAFDYLLKSTVFPDPELGHSVGELLGKADHLSASFPMVGMGIDSSDGTMSLRDNKYLDISAPTGHSEKYFDNVLAVMKDISKQLGSTDLRKLLSWDLLNKSITVHPLGGCPMGTNATNGVVDSNGQVFNYPGLYVADGSVIPAAVGVNPSLTIAALADHFADSMIQ